MRAKQRGAIEAPTQLTLGALFVVILDSAITTRQILTFASHGLTTSGVASSPKFPLAL